MGCQAGFYFLFDSRHLSGREAVELVKRVFRQASTFDGPMPGKSERECGNCRNLDWETRRKVCAWCADLIADWAEEKLAY